MPPGVVTATGPDVAAAGTVAVIAAADATENVAGSPLNVTAVAPAKPLPVTVTVLPGAPVAGSSVATTGAAGITTNGVALVPVPPAVVTATDPVAAPAGTSAVIRVSETTVNAPVGAAPKVTAVARVKWTPVSVTTVPVLPDAGSMPVTAGGGGTGAVWCGLPPAVDVDAVSGWQVVQVAARSGCAACVVVVPSAR